MLGPVIVTLLRFPHSKLLLNVALLILIILPSDAYMLLIFLLMSLSLAASMISLYAITSSSLCFSLILGMCFLGYLLRGEEGICSERW